MKGYPSKWVGILGLSILFLSLASHAQQTTILNASVAAAEPTPFAPEPATSPAPEPLIAPSSTSIRTTSPVVGQKRVADRQFWAFVSVTAATAIMDGESTIHGLQTPGRREMNPVLGSHPNRLRFYSTVGATDAGFGYLAYRLRRGGHDKLWRIPLVGAGFAHLSGAINNLQY
jgi:hypothetical protein